MKPLLDIRFTGNQYRVSAGQDVWYFEDKAEVDAFQARYFQGEGSAVGEPASWVEKAIRDAGIEVRDKEDALLKIAEDDMVLEGSNAAILKTLECYLAMIKARGYHNDSGSLYWPLWNFWYRLNLENKDVDP